MRNILRASRYKTKNREYILDALSNNLNTTLSADNIFDYLKSKDKDMNITTIYRNLEKLANENLVLKFPSADGNKTFYQLKCHDYTHEDHLHLQCTNCGKVIHLDCDFMQSFVDHVKDDHQFDLTCGNSILFGLCDKCKKKNLNKK
jgi:Fur family ferric uptake transcriptional regulator